jgi:hypothetical protein
MCKTRPNVPLGTLLRFETIQSVPIGTLFTKRMGMAEYSCGIAQHVRDDSGNRMTTASRGRQTAIAAKISVRVFLQEHFFGLAVAIGWRDRTQAQELSGRNVPLGTFVLLDQLLRSRVKLEKCSCRNTVENSGVICCKFK